MVVGCKVVEADGQDGVGEGAAGEGELAQLQAKMSQKARMKRCWMPDRVIMVSVERAIE